MSDSAVLTEGAELFRAGKYADALSYFLSLPEDSGADGCDVAYYLGLCYAKLGRQEDALLYLEQVVTSGKSIDRVLQCRLLLAVIYVGSGRRSLAEFELEKLLEAGYRPASVYAVTAFSAWERNDTEKCLEYYRKSLEADPDNPTSLNGFGYVLACEGRDLSRALSMCKKAVDLSPDSAACLDSLGWVYHKLGLADDAKKYLAQAERLDGDNEIIAEHIRIAEGHGEGV